MKYTIAAFLGIANAFVVIDKFGRQQQVDLAASIPISESAFLQTQDDDMGTYEEIAAVNEGSPAFDNYERKIPDQFSQERDDRLMHSLITNYAREIKRDGKLTGAFFLNKDDAFAASTEFVSTHFNYSTEKAQKWLKDNTFEDTWNHFDVNHDGLVEVERFPMFLRSVTMNALDIDLQ